MPAFDQGSGEVPGAPVFVDISGRRDRRLRAAAWTLSALAAVYASGVGLSVVTAPTGSLAGDLPFHMFGTQARGDARVAEPRSHAADPAPIPDTGTSAPVIANARDAAPAGAAGAVRDVSSQRDGAEPEIPAAPNPVAPNPATAGASPVRPPAQNVVSPDGAAPAPEGDSANTDAGQHHREAPSGRNGPPANGPKQPVPEAPDEPQQPGSAPTEPNTPVPGQTEPPAGEQHDPPRDGGESTPDTPSRPAPETGDGSEGEPEPGTDPDLWPVPGTAPVGVVDRLRTVVDRGRLVDQRAR